MGATDQPTPLQNEREGEVDETESELKKQEMLVQYLKDTESFALQVERAIAVINNMLYWKTTTGIICIFIGINQMCFLYVLYFVTLFLKNTV